MRTLLLMVTFTHIGCSLPKAGQPIVKLHSDAGKTLMGKAPIEGFYELRAEKGAADPVARVRLLASETLGFERVDASGQQERFAIAGSNPELCPGHKRILLPEGDYYWTLAAESEIPGPRWKWAMQKLGKKLRPDPEITAKECLQTAVVAVALTGLYVTLFGLYVYSASGGGYR